MRASNVRADRQLGRPAVHVSRKPSPTLGWLVTRLCPSRANLVSQAITILLLKNNKLDRVEECCGRVTALEMRYRVGLSVVIEADTVVRLFQSQAVAMVVEIVLVVCTFTSQSFTQVDVRAAVVTFNSGYLQICSAWWRDREHRGTFQSRAALPPRASSFEGVQ